MYKRLLKQIINALLTAIDITARLTLHSEYSQVGRMNWTELPSVYFVITAALQSGKVVLTNFQCISLGKSRPRQNAA